MPVPKVYVETSIPSANCTSRTDTESLARKNWTQHWWDFKREGYEVYTSEIVLDELDEGDYPTKRENVALMQGVPLLAVEPRCFRDCKDIHSAFRDAGKAAAQCGAFGSGIISSLRFSLNLELRTLGQRKQVSTHPARQYDARPFCSELGDAA